MAEPAVIIRTHRGIGNQLFQFAAGFALARRLDAPIRYDIGQTAESRLRPCLGERWSAASTRELWRCGMVRRPPLLAQASRVRRPVSRVVRGALALPPRRFEPATPDRYDPGFERLTAPCYLIGYFQHQGYWADMIDPLTAMIGDGLGIAPTTATSGVVGLHVRRGDYLDEGWTLSPAYYRNALQAITDQIDRPVLRVFGDDDAFVHDFEAELERDGHVVDRDRGSARHADPSLDDLIRLAECDHLVISNSSYAWWGAALGDRLHRGRSRLVILPTEWLDGRDSAVLCRPDWQQVACSDDEQPASNRPPDRDSVAFSDWWLPTDGNARR
jgi:hypothetical protein